jgi:Tol biopolymer transport system component
MVVHGGQHQQIAVLDIQSGGLTEITTDPTDHWNPAIANNAQSIAYHKRTTGRTTPNVQRWGAPPDMGLNMLRLAGSFPAISPDAKRLALTGGSFARVDVMNVDGTKRKSIFKTKRRSLFGMTWSHEPERVAFSHGVVFGAANVEVNVMAVSPDDDETTNLTSEAGNNGFPSYSPDGKQIVFRSGRDGPKNLYIMDRLGQNARRLTNGDWTDTMCDWSPLGDWITFASDRDTNFEIWMIRPDGSGLRKLIGGGGRNNHPHFSPDANWIVFTSQRAGYSAEEVSLPSQPQPYGDIFMVRTDGTGLTRLTHNGSEEGTPAWASPTQVKLSDEGTVDERDY